MHPAHTQPPPVPVRPGRLSGARVLAEWGGFNPRDRHRILRAAARSLRDHLHAAGPFQADLPEFVFTREPPGWHAQAWPPPRAGRRPASTQEILAWLARQWDALEGRLSRREALLFLRQLLRGDGASGRSAAAFASLIDARVRRERHRHARLLAAAAREEPLRSGNGAFTAVRWTGGPAEEHLAFHVEQWITHPDVRELKRSPEARVVRVQSHGRDIVVKLYPAGRGLDRLKDRWRAPRALRAWTAARVFEELGLPAPRPLAVLLDATILGNRCHAFVSEFIGDAVTARDWIRPRLHRRPPEFRARVARQLLHFFGEMERFGVVHGDMKASNLLVRLDPEGLACAHWWIDLEAVRFDRAPGPRLLLRNLIQLNGSVGQRLSREDRLAFLAAYAETRPWARARGLAERIEQVTRLRLQREVRRECGH